MGAGSLEPRPGGLGIPDPIGRAILETDCPLDIKLFCADKPVIFKT